MNYYFYRHRPLLCFELRFFLNKRTFSPSLIPIISLSFRYFVVRLWKNPVPMSSGRGCGKDEIFSKRDEKEPPRLLGAHEFLNAHLRK